MTGPNTFTLETGNLLLDGTFRSLSTESYTVPSALAPMGTMEQVTPISGKPVISAAYFDAYKAVDSIPQWVRSTQTYTVAGEPDVIVGIIGISDPNSVAIVTQPASQTVTPGQNASFTVVASGTPPSFTYQWQRSTNNGVNWSNLSNGGSFSGAQAATLAVSGITTAMTGHKFRVVVNNSAGSATSNPATLTINPAVVITTQPASQTVTAGQNTSFTVAASGTPTSFTYQWQLSTGLSRA